MAPNENPLPKETTMTKIKQFYKNHEKTILIGSGFLAGSLTFAYLAANALRGKDISDVHLYEIVETGKKFLHVEFVNGTVRDFEWQEALPK